MQSPPFYKLHRKVNEMLIQFVELYNSNHLTDESYEKIRQKLSKLIGKKIQWHSKHEGSTNKQLEVVIERLSKRFATVFCTLEGGQRIRYTINYHNLICGDDEIYI